MEYMNLEEFRQEYKQLSELFGGRDDFETILESWFTIHRHSLPPFPANNYFHKERVDEEVEYKTKHIEKLMINPECCVGETWLYRNDRSGGRPLPERLARLCLGRPENIPAVIVDGKVGDKYICNDGNHRIYVAYLLGRQVKVIDYKEA